jgi:16S rRNA G966 N2-methylase RsmD
LDRAGFVSPAAEDRVKYMGSKSQMLEVGLRNVLDEVVPRSTNFVDLFAGSGSVAIDVASRHVTEVLAIDVQEYSAILTGSVIRRTEPFPRSAFDDWLDAVSDTPFSGRNIMTKEDVLSDRARAQAGDGFVERHYGGHYFSLDQARRFDRLLKTLPFEEAGRDLALGAIIDAASACAAAPGHTAQPFQPTETALPHIASAWRRDPVEHARRYLERNAPRHALVEGRVYTGDALSSMRSSIPPGSVVFCDPPYSEVQYSRFYHVLEGIARGGWQEISGFGRAPDLKARYSSEFSLVRRSGTAFRELFSALQSLQCHVVLTFPNYLSSNGQSADSLARIAGDYFEVEKSVIYGRHSSLGGRSSDTSSRKAHRSVEEAVLVMHP